MRKEVGRIFDRGLVLEQMGQEDEISISILWKLGLGAIWVLIKEVRTQRVRMKDLVKGSQYGFNLLFQ
jgi:hypothetical protein